MTAMTQWARLDIRLAIAVFLAWVSGLRLLGRDHDYQSYQIIYARLVAGHPNTYEWLFVKMAEVLGAGLHLPFTGFLLVCALVATVIKVVAFHRYAARFWIAILAYVLIYWVLHEMTQIRSGLALAFAAVAFGLLQQGAWPLAIAAFLMAVLFHLSLAAMAPFILVPQVWRGTDRKRPVAILVLLAAAAFAVRYFDALSTFSDQYIGGRAAGYGEHLLSVRLVVCSAISGIGIWKLEDIEQRFRPYVWMSVWASLLYVAFYWEAAYANRLFEMAGFFMLFWVGALKGWPNRLTMGLFFFYGMVTAANYIRYGYLVFGSAH